MLGCFLLGSRGRMLPLASDVRRARFARPSSEFGSFGCAPSQIRTTQFGVWICLFIFVRSQIRSRPKHKPKKQATMKISLFLALLLANVNQTFAISKVRGVKPFSQARRFLDKEDKESSMDDQEDDEDDKAPKKRDCKSGKTD